MWPTYIYTFEKHLYNSSCERLTYFIQFTVTEVLDSDIQKSKNSEHEDGNKHDKVSDSVECDLIDNVDTQAPLTDTLTSSTLTARLSSKWQVSSLN
jgi:hypothetical protein